MKTHIFDKGHNIRKEKEMNFKKINGVLIDLNSISAVGNIREMPRPRGEFTLFQFSIYLKNSSIKIDISMYEHETIVETREELIQELTGEIKC